MSPPAREVLAKGRSSSPGAARLSAIALLQQLRRRVQPERAVPPLTKVPRVMATRGPGAKGDRHARQKGGGRRAHAAAPTPTQKSALDWLGGRRK
jgi:hypothetical protein